MLVLVGVFVPGPLQSVQRAKLWGVILALQANDGVHLGVDNLGVVRHVGRHLGRDMAIGSCRGFCSVPGPLQSVQRDEFRGSFLLFKLLMAFTLVSVACWMAMLTLVLLSLSRMVILFCLLRGCSVFESWTRFVFLMLTVMLMRPWFGLGVFVILIDWEIMGRTRLLILPWWVIDARRNCSGVCAHWRPHVVGLHQFFIAIARTVVNHDGAGTALDPMVWSVGGAPKRRRVVHAVRDRAFLPGSAGIWDGEWGVVAATHVTCHDVELWQ